MPSSVALNPSGGAGAARQQAGGRAGPAGSSELACSASGRCAGCAVGGRGAGAAADPRAIAEEVVAIVSAHHWGTAAGPSGWTFEMICAACQPSDAALDVTLELVNLILSGELPREAFLLGQIYMPSAVPPEIIGAL